MKIAQETIYRCGYCNKPMFGKGAMVRHEKWCKENPNNKHKCFDFCQHLKREHRVIEVNGEPYRVTDMTCTKLNKQMYSYKLEKTANCPPLNNMERMPLECKDHNYMESYLGNEN